MDDIDERARHQLMIDGSDLWGKLYDPEVLHIIQYSLCVLKPFGDILASQTKLLLLISSLSAVSLLGSEFISLYEGRARWTGNYKLLGLKDMSRLNFPGGGDVLDNSLRLRVWKVNRVNALRSGSKIKYLHALMRWDPLMSPGIHILAA